LRVTNNHGVESEASLNADVGSDSDLSGSTTRVVEFVSLLEVLGGQHSEAIFFSPLDTDGSGSCETVAGREGLVLGAVSDGDTAEDGEGYVDPHRDDCNHKGNFWTRNREELDLTAAVLVVLSASASADSEGTSEGRVEELGGVGGDLELEAEGSRKLHFESDDETDHGLVAERFCSGNIASGEGVRKSFVNVGRDGEQVNESVGSGDDTLTCGFSNCGDSGSDLGGSGSDSLDNSLDWVGDFDLGSATTAPESASLSVLGFGDGAVGGLETFDLVDVRASDLGVDAALIAINLLSAVDEVGRTADDCSALGGSVVVPVGTVIFLVLVVGNKTFTVSVDVSEERVLNRNVDVSFIKQLLITSLGGDEENFISSGDDSVRFDLAEDGLVVALVLRRLGSEDDREIIILLDGSEEGIRNSEEGEAHIQVTVFVTDHASVI
jgi:hypothetical protein